ncbi:MAG TPA: substrate-binding domain-containing protein, partial [Candidatus Nanopelagicales bacterium]|nr:substrate-binding domain-containing protein [Candidatus Nanopelagicales bacterium]
AVLTPHPGRWFFGQVLSGAESVVADRGLDLLLYDLGTAASRQRFFGEFPLRRRVDAVLCIAMPLTRTQTDQLRSLNVPISLVGARSRGMSSVRISDREAARSAVRHLVALGHHRIGMIATETHDNQFLAVSERRHGYQAELRAHGLPVDERLITSVPFGLAGGESAIDTLLDLADPPTAVFCESDELAYGALAALRKRRMKVPGQLSLIGIDDHDMSDLLELTTLRQNVFEQGARAAQLLVAAMAHGAAPLDVLLPTELVVRGSTGPPEPVRSRRARTG